MADWSFLAGDLARPRRWLRLWGWSVLVLGLGCSLETGDAPRYGGAMRIGSMGGMTPLNPIITYQTVSAPILDLLFERLLNETPEGQIAPALAQSWTSNEEHTVWDFALRPGVSFHDGQSVTAEDVVFTLELMKQHRGRAEWQGYMDLRFSRIEAIGTDTVRLHFASPPSPSFLLHLRQHILPKHLVAPQLAAGYALDELPFNKAPVGAGPFRFDRWLSDAHVRMVAFEEYYGGRPFLDSLEVRADYKDTRYLWSGLMHNELDLVTHAATEDILSIVDDESFSVLQSLGRAYLALTLNCRQSSLLADGRLRMALDKAIDRKAIWKAIGGKQDIADSLVFSTGPFMPGSPHYDRQIATPRKSQQRARELLAAAGWRDENGDGVREKAGQLLALELVMPNELPHLSDIAAQLRKDLEEVGIRLQVKTVRAQDITMDLEFDLLVSGGYDFYDPDMTVAKWHSASARNFSGIQNAQIDSLIEQGRTIYDTAVRERIYKSIHALLAENRPALFIYRMPVIFCFRKGLQPAESTGQLGLFRSLPSWRR